MLTQSQKINLDHFKQAWKMPIKTHNGLEKFTFHVRTFRYVLKFSRVEWYRRIFFAESHTVVKEVFATRTFSGCKIFLWRFLKVSPWVISGEHERREVDTWKVRILQLFLFYFNANAKSKQLSSSHEILRI